MMDVFRDLRVSKEVGLCYWLAEGFNVFNITELLEPFFYDQTGCEWYIEIYSTGALSLSGKTTASLFLMIASTVLFTNLQTYLHVLKVPPRYLLFRQERRL